MTTTTERTLRTWEDVAVKVRELTQGFLDLGRESLEGYEVLYNPRDMPHPAPAAIEAHGWEIPVRPDALCATGQLYVWLRPTMAMFDEEER